MLDHLDRAHHAAVFVEQHVAVEDERAFWGMAKVEQHLGDARPHEWDNRWSFGFGSIVPIDRSTVSRVIG